MESLLLALLVLVLPVASVVIERTAFAGPGTAGAFLLFGKWVMFWGMGVRLLLTSLWPTLLPAYSTRQLARVPGSQPAPPTQALTLAHVAVGLVGVAALFFPNWVFEAALVGFVFFGLFGLEHWRQPRKSGYQYALMASELCLAAFLLCFALYRMRSSSSF
ncbi:MAG: hypothetical protein IT317_20765 [Anaerolineales bacterium]|nr:hypothetical protein [Anaerolineales bacterium]